MQFKKEELVKSPLNYTGGKYKLLPKILPLFPDKIETFVDMFCGGLNVAINIEANKIIANDLEHHVIDFYNSLTKIDGNTAHTRILDIVNEYGLNKTNQEGFLKLREDYNNNQTWDKFYAVISHAFNYQIRYNKTGGYNMPFGKDRSSYNESLQEKLVKFTDIINSKNIEFVNKDFIDLNVEVTNETFFYADPPYLISTASYNEQDGWNLEHEKKSIIFIR